MRRNWAYGLALKLARLYMDRSGQRRSFAGSQLEEFTSVLEAAHKVTVLSGAGISAESGIPTFRGAGGLWRNFDATELATPYAFAANPSLVWEFYHYRRCIVAAAAPNAGHYALEALQRKCEHQGKLFTLLTQVQPLCQSHKCNCYLREFII
jgi:NAD-dependent deacetylase sirtuin 5